MTKFKVGDKVRILDVKSIDYGSKFWQNGDITKVTRIKAERGVYLATPCSSDEGLYVTKTELDYIEKVSDTPTKNQRITTLESEVAELKAKVEALEKAQSVEATVKAIAHAIEKHTSKKSPNEQRKAIIAEAKAFVAKVEAQLGCAHADRTQGNYTYQETSGYAKYIVNAEKRTVVALVHSKYTDKVIEKAIAKCAPDDAFNADIGKAIALGRALGLDVSRFEQAVKPTEVVVGMKVTACFDGKTEEYTARNVYKEGGEVRVNPKEVMLGYYSYEPRVGDRIIDDSEAQY